MNANEKGLLSPQKGARIHQKNFVSPRAFLWLFGSARIRVHSWLKTLAITRRT
jgi:hypothetical protein